MTTLADLRCAPCHGTSEAMTDSDIGEMLHEIPDWKVTEMNGSKRLQRTFLFDDFESALEFTNQVGELAEENNHHPAILTEWGKVTVTWWTHAVNGLHRNDFIMAAKCDEALAEIDY